MQGEITGFFFFFFFLTLAGRGVVEGKGWKKLVRWVGIGMNDCSVGGPGSVGSLQRPRGVSTLVVQYCSAVGVGWQSEGEGE